MELFGPNNNDLDPEHRNPNHSFDAAPRTSNEMVREMMRAIRAALLHILRKIFQRRNPLTSQWAVAVQPRACEGPNEEVREWRRNVRKTRCSRRRLHLRRIRV